MKNRIDEIKNGDCGLMKIIKYNGAKNIKVKFKTGSIVKTTYQHFKNGLVKDPLFPSVYEVGYPGNGKFKTTINSKQTIEYNAWRNMLKRCYDPCTINKHLTYQNAIVCKEWLNFQTFAEWFHRNYYELFDERVDLDKDIIKKGNKIYCLEYCSFVPQSINTLLIKSNSSRGKYPIGVNFNKRSNKYIASISIDGESKHLGHFITSLEAFSAYKIAKEKQIKIIANKYKEVLSVKVYNSLMDYIIKITD